MKCILTQLMFICLVPWLLGSFANAQTQKIAAYKKLESSFMLLKDKDTYKTLYGEHAYHPASWTIGARFATKKPTRTNADWKEVKLPFKKLDGINFSKLYKNDVPAHLRLSKKSDQLVIIFSGSSSDFSGGAWVNQTVHYIDTVAKSKGVREVPNILAFDGYFTPKSLSAKPKLPPLTTDLLAKDLFIRITHYAKKFMPKVKDWGVVGFSGGATISVTFTRAASVAHEILETPNPLQRLGTVSFSPVIDGRISMVNIDRGADLAVNEGGIGKRHGFRNRASWMYFWSPETALKLVDNKNDLDWYQAMLYNNFVSHVLYDVVEAFPEFKWNWDLQTDSERTALEGSRFSHFFLDYAFKKHQEAFSLEEDFDEYSSFVNIIHEIKTDIYMVFSLDDMMLLRHPDDADSDSIDVVKERADTVNQMENVHLFLPERGGHLGYLVDGSWQKKVIAELLSPIKKQRELLRAQ